MFTKSLYNHIEEKSNNYVAEVLNKFCFVGTLKASSLEQCVIQLQYIEALLESLAYMQEFELEENQLKLNLMQQGLSKMATANPQDKASFSANLAINTIMMYLKKGEQDDTAQKFHDGIEVAIAFFQEKKENLSNTINQNTNDNGDNDKSAHAISSGFFSPEPICSPSKKCSSSPNVGTVIRDQEPAPEIQPPW